MESKEKTKGQLIEEIKVLKKRITELERSKSERKKMERTLLERKEFVENLIASMKDGFSVLDREGVHIDVNKTLCRMTGFTREELIGIGPPHPYWPEEEYEKIKKAFQKTLRRKFEDFELVFKRKNGERFPVIVSPSCMEDKGGKIISYFATFKDITERKKTEETLRNSKEFIENVFNSVSDSLSVIDTNNFRTVKVNRAFLNILKMEEKDVIGKHCYEVTHHSSEPCKAPQHTCPLAETLKTGCHSSAHHIHCDKDGREIYVEVSTSPIRNEKGEIYQVVHFARDITKRKRAEEALVKERNLLRTVIDNLPDYIYIKDTDGRYIVSNIAHARFFGATTPAEVVGKTVFELFPQELAEQYNADDQKIIRTGQPLVNREERSVDQTGNKVWNLTTKMPLRDSNGKIVGLVGIARDITEYRQMEEKLRESEGKWHSLAENAPNMIIIVNRDGIIQFINRTLPGFSIGEAMGKNIYDHVYPEYHNVVRETIKQVFKTGEPGSYENIAPGPYGRDSWYETRVGAIKRNGQVVAVTLFITDITERKKMEEERKNLAKFPSENPHPVLRIKQDGALLYANAASSSLLNEWGCEIGQPVPEQWSRLVADVFDSGLRKNIEIDHRDQIFSFVVVPMVEASYVNFYGLDITEQKKIDKELKKKMRDLETFQKVAVGRELKMAELKNKIKGLEAGFAGEISAD